MKGFMLGQPERRFCLPVLLTALWVLTGTAFAQENASKNVILLYPHESEMNSFAGLDQSLRAALVAGNRLPVVFYTEYLDLMRFADADHKEKLIEYLGAKYAGRRIDLIVVISSLAFDFIVDRGEEIFPGVPVVFTSVAVETVARAHLRPNVTGVSVTRTYRDTLDLILRLQPDTTHLFIPIGSTPLEKTWTADVRRSLEPLEERIAITYLAGLSMADLLQRLRHLPAHTAVLFSPLFFYDGTGRYFLPDDALALVAEASSVPVYGTEDSYLGRGIVGGVLYELAAVGAAGGRMAQRVLAGEAPANIPVETLNPNRLMVDMRQLKRWGISRALLPPDSVVRYEERSAWDLYSGYILGGVALVLIQSVMILGLVVQARRLKQSESLLKELSGHLMHVQDEERSRIARELHDDFGQRLALLQNELEMLAREESPAHRAAGPGKLRAIIEDTGELAADLHTMSHALHSSKLQLLGLRSALEELCANVAKQHDITVELHADGFHGPTSQDVALCLYRIAQEALHNAAKHSGGRNIVVKLSDAGALLRLRIADNGRGFDPAEASEGLGLASMRERVGMIGGALIIQSAPGRGTELTAQVRTVS